LSLVDVITCAAMYGLDDEPRSSKEKWLMRAPFLLVAFLWWEYVKAIALPDAVDPDDSVRS